MEQNGLKTQRNSLRLYRHATTVTKLLVCLTILAFTSLGDKHLNNRSAKVKSMRDRNIELRTAIFKNEKSFENNTYEKPFLHLFFVVLGVEN